MRGSPEEDYGKVKDLQCGNFQFGILPLRGDLRIVFLVQHAFGPARGAR